MGKKIVYYYCWYFLDKYIPPSCSWGLQIQPQSIVMGSPISVADELQLNHGGKLWLAIEEMKEGSQFIT
jgi:hypothetical protein